MPTAQPIPASTAQKTAMPATAESEEAAEAHLEDPGGDRDERADERRGEAERHSDVLEAREPALGARDPRGRDVHVAAVALEQRMSAAHADPPAARRTEAVAGDPGDDDREVGGQPRT